MPGCIEDRWIKRHQDPITGKKERTARYGKGKRIALAVSPGFETGPSTRWRMQRRGSAVPLRTRSAVNSWTSGRFYRAFRLHRAVLDARKGRCAENQGRAGTADPTPCPAAYQALDAQADHGGGAAPVARWDGTIASPDYRRGVLGELSAILETAVDDRRITRNPMRSKSVRWPKASKARREAWLMATALRTREVIGERHRIAVVLGLGCGLRQGEVFGVSPKDIDWTRGLLRVRRQVQTLGVGSTTPFRRVGSRAVSTCRRRLRQSCAGIWRGIRRSRWSCHGANRARRVRAGRSPSSSRRASATLSL